jgi:hypothetical protein
VHIDAALEYNEGPSFMAQLTLYRHDSKPRAVSVRLDDEVHQAEVAVLDAVEQDATIARTRRSGTG